MFEKTGTPYQYTYQNPIRYNDPTGMKGEGVDNDYKLEKDGKITLVNKTDDAFDRLYATKENGEIEEDSVIKINKNKANDETIISDLSNVYKQGESIASKEVSFASTFNGKDAADLYEFVSRNTPSVEWAISAHCDNSTYVISTSHYYDSSGKKGIVKFVGLGLYGEDNTNAIMHSHPSTVGPSDADRKNHGKANYLNYVYYVGKDNFARGNIYRFVDRPTGDARSKVYTSFRKPGTLYLFPMFNKKYR